MKTKEFNASSELEKIAQKMSNHNEDLLAIYVNDKKEELSIVCTGKDDENIICTIATILEISLTGKGDEGMDRVTHIILESLKLVHHSSSLAGLKLAMEMLKGIAEKTELLDNKEENDEDEEDCGNCELVKTCNLNTAIKYRKEHGIPRPKKGKSRKVNVN